jgi:outer membrane murein-binding lipoprotein Lpp
MSLLANLSLRGKLYAGFTPLVLGLVVVALVGINGVGSGAERTASITGELDEMSSVVDQLSAVARLERLALAIGDPSSAGDRDALRARARA